MKKVLYVDDDLVSQKVVAAALRSTFEVIGETSGARVLERAESVHPHAILLDLSMPHVDGFEVLTRLKRHPLLSNIAVICVSGKLDEESRARAYRAGAAGFIGKPIDVLQIGQDLTLVLESLNSEVQSEDQQRTVYIGRNSTSSIERMKDLVTGALAQEKKVAVMSLTGGESFFRDFDREPLKTGQLLYLEMKPSLIVRLPYLEDLSSVAADIVSFLPGHQRDYELFFDGPEQIINVIDHEKTAVKLMALSETLIKLFSRVHFFAKYTNDESMNQHINGMAKLLARVA